MRDDEYLLIFTNGEDIAISQPVSRSFVEDFMEDHKDINTEGWHWCVKSMFGIMELKDINLTTGEGN